MPVSVFFLVFEFRRKGISNGVQTERNLRERDFLMNVIQRSWSASQEEAEASTLVGPLLLHRRTPSSYIYLRTPNDQIWSRNPNSTAITFCIHEIPSWGLFRSSGGEGIYHGGLLHQHHSLSDDVWVVYLRPPGPQLLARWLLLSFWISIQCSPPLLWRSIRCNLLFAVCLLRPMNCGFMIQLIYE